MITARILALGGFQQLDEVVQRKQTELMRVLIIPKYHLYFHVQPNLSIAADHSLVQLRCVKEHFEEFNNLRVCVSDKGEKETSDHLNQHGALCMVSCGTGTNLLCQIGLGEFLIRCPRVVIICQQIGARTAAIAALKAGAHAAIWFRFDTLDIEAFKLFFQRVLCPCLEKALPVASVMRQEWKFRQAEQDIMDILRIAKRAKPSIGDCPFGIEFAEGLKNLDDALLPKELGPPSQQSRVDVKFRECLRGNFKICPKERKERALLACDLTALTKAENVFDGKSSQHLHITHKRNETQDGNRCQTIAQHLCTDLYRKRQFCAIHHLKR